MKIILTALAIFLTAGRLCADEPVRSKLKIPLEQDRLQETVYKHRLDIEHGGPGYLYAYITEYERSLLDSAGIIYEIIYEDYRDESAWVFSLLDLGEYHSYEETAFFLDSVAIANPSICKLDTLGQSIEGRLIMGIRISDNPAAEEDEAEVRIMGAHHGDERISVELPLYMIDYLTANYEGDSTVTRLVNEREIYIIPMVNPDGVTRNSRYNARYQDLNRDYLCPEGDDCPWGANHQNSFSEPETQAIRQDAMLNRYTLSLSMHSGATNINAVWNYDDGLHENGEYHETPDDELIMDLSYSYANLNRTPGFYVTNGCDWYSTHGDANDFSYGYLSDIDWTIEISLIKTPPEEDIETYWNANREAMMFIIDAADIGIRGVVTDSATGQPLDATVWIEEGGFPFFTDPIVGDYHRPLLPGSYHIRVESAGYISAESGPIEVVSGPAQRCDFRLVPAEMAIFEISVFDSSAGEPLPAFVQISSGNFDTLVVTEGSPVTITLNADIYDIDILAPGYIPAYDHSFITGYIGKEYLLRNFDDELFFDDFEEDPSAWAYGGTHNQWGIADRGYRSDRSLQDSPQYYSSNSWSWARINTLFDLSSYRSAGVYYFEEHELQPYYDFLFPEISTNGGATWTILPDTLTGFSTSEWKLRYISLDGYCAPESNSMALRFRFFSGPEISYDGVYIDDFYFGGIDLPTGLAGTVEPPDRLELNQNYPNPFNSTTIISLTGDPDNYPEIEIYDILGRLVKRLKVADESGRYVWTGLDGRGNPVSSGIYFYGVSGGQKIRSMTLLR
jgi:hypothetical protein